LADGGAHAECRKNIGIETIKTRPEGIGMEHNAPFYWQHGKQTVCRTWVAGAGGLLMYLAGLWGAPVAAAAAPLLVCKTGCSYTSIQSAVDAAASGDQIFIGRGVYTENVTIVGKSVVLDGSGPDLTVVDGGGVASVFTLGSGHGSTSDLVVLKNLTITHGLAGNYPQDSGGGITVQAGAALDLISCDVTKNEAQNGGGIEVNTPNGATTTISDSTVESNTAAIGTHGEFGFGAGINVESGSTIVVSGTTFRANQTFGYGGGLQTALGAHATVTNSVFYANVAEGRKGQYFYFPGYGGGIDANSDITISNSTFLANLSDFGGGISVSLSGGPQSIVGSTISHNGLKQDPPGPPYLGDCDGGDSCGSGGIYVGYNNSNPNALLSLDHDYVGQNDAYVGDVGVYSFNGAPLARIKYTNSTIGDPKNSGCIGNGCP